MSENDLDIQIKRFKQGTHLYSGSGAKSHTFLNIGSSFIGFLWRVRRAVYPWDSLNIFASICWLLVLLALWMGIFPLGFDLLVFSHAGVSVGPSYPFAGEFSRCVSQPFTTVRS